MTSLASIESVIADLEDIHDTLKLMRGYCELGPIASKHMTTVCNQMRSTKAKLGKELAEQNAMYQDVDCG